MAYLHFHRVIGRYDMHFGACRYRESLDNDTPQKNGCSEVVNFHAKPNIGVAQ